MIPTNSLGTNDIAGFCEGRFANGNDQIKEDNPMNAVAKKPSNQELNRKQKVNVTNNSTVAPAIGQPNVMVLSIKTATKIVASIMA